MGTVSEIRQPLNSVATPRLPFLSVSNLCKVYASGKSVIRDLSVSAAPGEFISVLGESGCGKSTLLKMIAGLSPCTGGSIRIDGRTPERARDLMSFVFQDPALLPWRTVARNVELALEFEGVPKKARAARVESVL
jgi:NitT/TauT family transport system ATP-binding protein